ncbi:hypothetical protein ACGFMM_24750 [Streptomyces sp. NPDC048604]|uniref:hypothetical protein n=1 Tax=Streptomyces sp. NPDC048604 TaxID=3365578 RepID=UPI0037112BEB
MSPSVRPLPVVAALALAVTALASEPVIGWDAHPAGAFVAQGQGGAVGWDSAPADRIGWDSVPADRIGWDSVPADRIGWDSAPTAGIGWD